MAGKQRKQRPFKHNIAETELTDAPDFDPATLYSRNWAFLSADAQAKLSETVLFAAGVGVASNILSLGCRTGFRRFILADWDTVELSNLNRQAFSSRQIGKNKAKATAKRLRRIRPDVEVEVLPYALQEATLLDPLARATIVINSLDFDQRALFLLNYAAQITNKPIIQPLNLGWGAAVLTFLPTSPRLEDFIGVVPGKDDPSTVQEHLISKVVSLLPGGLPEYLHPLFADYIGNRTTWTSEPQLGVAAALTAALAVRVCVALALGEPVKAVPDIAYCDARTLTEPEGVGNTSTSWSSTTSQRRG